MLDRTTLQRLREPHPQQAAIDDECARLLLATARESTPELAGFAHRGLAYAHRPSRFGRRRKTVAQRTPRAPAIEKPA